jgi:hypothetical protein
MSSCTFCGGRSEYCDWCFGPQRLGSGVINGVARRKQDIRRPWRSAAPEGTGRNLRQPLSTSNVLLASLTARRRRELHCSSPRRTPRTLTFFPVPSAADGEASGARRRRKKRPARSRT